MARTQVTRLCEYCGASFTRRFKTPQPKYCSRRCIQNAVARARRRDYLVRFKERLKAFADQNVCWLWRGSATRDGYGLARDNTRRRILVHRIAWEITYGPIPDGLGVLHKCDIRNCFNPTHLFLGTNAENMRDMVTKGRSLRGERNHKARLTVPEVRAIRAAPGPARAIAAQFGIPLSRVSDIRAGRSWKHVV